MVHISWSASQLVLTCASGLSTHCPVAGTQRCPPSHGGTGPEQVTLWSNTQFPAPSQWSTVHRFPSASQLVLNGASGLSTHCPVEGSQCCPPSHGGTGPGQFTVDAFTQLPAPSQWSTVHRFPSASQLVLTGASGLSTHCPVEGSQRCPPSHGGTGAAQVTSWSSTQFPAPSQ
jgi:hypothetical protein